MFTTKVPTTTQSSTMSTTMLVFAKSTPSSTSTPSLSTNTSSLSSPVEALLQSVPATLASMLLSNKSSTINNITTSSPTWSLAPTTESPLNDAIDSYPHNFPGHFEGFNLAEFNASLNHQSGDIINNWMVQTMFCVLYGAICALGLFGNVLVCFVVGRNKAMQTVTNLFITNLALADILLCVLGVPFTPVYTFYRRWTFGMALCHLVAYAQGVSVYISTLTLTAIAIDRFFVIVYPFQQRMKLSYCLGIVLAVWIVSLILTVPYGLFMHVVMVNLTGTHTLYCEENWPSEYVRRLYGTLTSILQFVLPFMIVMYCYCSVSRRLNDRAKAKPGSKTSKKEEIDRDRKKRTNRMLMAMVAVFGLSWMPLNVVNMIYDFDAKIGEWSYYNLIFFCAHSVAMSSTCYNPFLYAWLNDNFRKEFKLVLPFFSASTRSRCLTGSQRWQPEQTYNGNNETIQESLLTSSFVRSNCPSVNALHANGQGVPATGPMNSSNSDNHILLSDIEATITVPSGTTATMGNPETHVLPSGVLETNFEGTMPVQPQVNEKRTKSKTLSTGRIRFQQDLPTNGRLKCIT